MKRTFTDKELFIRDAMIQAIPTLTIDGLHRSEYGLQKHQMASDAIELAHTLWEEWQGFLDREVDNRAMRCKELKREIVPN